MMTTAACSMCDNAGRAKTLCSRCSERAEKGEIAYDHMLGSWGLPWPEPACCMGNEKYCACPLMERALRGWMRGAEIPPMTAAQRAWCLSEINQVEGYRAADHVSETDAELAGSVLSAMADYCRDKGLL